MRVKLGSNPNRARHPTRNMSADVENLLKEINFLANSKGTNAFIRGKLSELHRAVRAQETKNEQLRAALKTIAENSHDIEACAWAWGALMKMKPATHGQDAATPSEK